MFELFVAMVREEWRLHATLFGNSSFALFPVLIFAIAFMGSFLLPIFRAVIPPGTLATLAFALFALLGLMVGAFGLLGKEVMNRRFGQVSLIAYSSRSLPLSERHIFSTFIVKDVVYYFILWILPFVIGFGAASPFIGVSPGTPFVLALTLSLSFLTGLSFAFFFSTLYAWSRWLLAAAAVVLLAGAAAVYTGGYHDPGSLYPPLRLFLQFTASWLVVSLLVILVPFAVSIAAITTEYHEAQKRFRDRFTSLQARLGFFRSPALTAKDLIDLSRSGGGVGQTIFSFLLPLGLIWLFLSLLSALIPGPGVFLVFSLLTGVVASTMYTWITEFDTFSTYAFLPLDAGSVMRSKVTTFTVMQAIPVAFLSLVAMGSGQVLYLVPGLVLCLGVSFYALAVITWLAGLSPNVLIYNPRVLGLFFLALSPVLLVLIALSFANPLWAFSAVVLAVPVLFLLPRSERKWNSWEHTTY
ncbi:hypothetical protein J2741_001410 [Methanolinea mesophila]|uniref:hypothetical protein n=1 Tax=Methanolinea mesophila TaxID=547055 RepID=UPI001AE178C5|nr:hypothetical protein [Methanolinea mesophila]MBP1928863.1 hypothetical protein [Methanolinea mesophila]